MSPPQNLRLLRRDAGVLATVALSPVHVGTTSEGVELWEVTLTRTQAQAGYHFFADAMPPQCEVRVRVAPRK